MARKSLLLGLLILINCSLIEAQTVLPAGQYNLYESFEKKIAALTHQVSLLKTQNRQLTQTVQRQQGQLTALQNKVFVQKDSIAEQQAAIEALESQASQLTSTNWELRTSLTQRTSDLKAATIQVAHLDYDKKTLIDNRIIRIYNFSPEEVRKQLLQSLSAPESGFQYDDGLIDDELKITRNFNGQEEAWWVFDKTLDTILELSVKIKPHLYNPQKALVYGSARVLQKTRFSNKPFDEQHDREKINLYSEKTLRLLEGKLSGTSDK